jgi:3-methyladenine DNA glycosylase AlkD
MTVPSATTVVAGLFVAEHRAQAAALGESLDDFLADAEEFTRALRAGFEALADPTYVAGQHLVAPGLGPVLGVRLPLMEATQKAFARRSRRAPSSLLLDAAGRLLRQETPELRWFAIWNLSRVLETDPERTWQLLRQAAREAGEWITVDTLAHPYGEGILREPRRWSELQNLLYSPSRWERRLVGSTIATIPFVKRLPGARDKATATRALTYLGMLIGEAEPDVQKALSWALRNLTAVDPVAVEAFLRAEAATARRTDDGNRAWVVRDGLTKLPAEPAAALRSLVEGIRRRPHASSTSRAAAAALANPAIVAKPDGAAPGAAQPREE